LCSYIIKTPEGKILRCNRNRLIKHQNCSKESQRWEFKEHNEELPAQDAACMGCKQFPSKDKGENNQDLQLRGNIFVEQKLPEVILRGMSIICCWQFPQVSWSLASALPLLSRYMLNILGEKFYS